MINMKKEVSKLHIIGDKSKKRIMLIHGVSFYWETCFKRIIELLKKDYCLIIPELEGHCSEGINPMKSVNHTAERIIKELSEVGIQSLDLLYGISLGASIALEICLKNRIEVLQLLLDSGQYESMGEMTEQFSDIMADQFLGILKGRHLMSPIKENMGYFTDNDVEVLFPLIYPNIKREILYRAFLAAYSYDIKNRIEKIGMNVGIMFGGNEIYAKNSIPLVEEKCIKKPEIYEMPGKGHAEVLSKEPEIIADIIMKNI